MGTAPHKISGSLSPQDFPDIWKNERPLPRANLNLSAVLRSLVQDVDMRFRFLEYLHVLKTEYAWDSDKCRAAQGYLAQLRNGLQAAESWKRSGDHLWRGALGIAAGLLAYAGYRATRDGPFGTADWVAVIAPAPLVFGAGLARALSSWVHREIAKDIQKLEDDINWRCIPHEIFELMVGMAVRTDPAADGVNFVALPPRRERAWTPADLGIAEPSYTLDGVVIGALSGGPLMRGAMLLWDEALSVLGPDAIPVGGALGDYLLPLSL